MNKIRLVLFLSLIMCLLVSCANYDGPRFVNSQDSISYNGAIYHIVDNDDQILIYYDEAYLQTELKPFEKGGFILPYFDMISLVWEDDFGNNVLFFRSTMYHGYTYYFKEGFEFPKYNEVALRRIVLYSDAYHEVIEFPDNKNITWNDIIDYNTTLILDNKECTSHEWYGELRDYSIDLFTGGFTVILVVDIVYIQTNAEINNKLYYKISDDYQQIFKDIINEYYK